MCAAGDWNRGPREEGRPVRKGLRPQKELELETTAGGEPQLGQGGGRAWSLQTPTYRLTKCTSSAATSWCTR